MGVTSKKMNVTVVKRDNVGNSGQAQGKKQPSGESIFTCVKKGNTLECVEREFPDTYIQLPAAKEESCLTDKQEVANAKTEEQISGLEFELQRESTELRVQIKKIEEDLKKAPDSEALKLQKAILDQQFELLYLKKEIEIGKLEAKLYPGKTCPKPSEWDD